MPNCREMCRHSSGALDGYLPWWQRPGMQLHLLFCRLCRRYRAQLILLNRATRRSRAAENSGARLSEAARARLIEALRGRLRSTGREDPGPGNVSPPSP